MRNLLPRNQAGELTLYLEITTQFVFCRNAVEKSVDWTELYKFGLTFFKKRLYQKNF